MSDRLIRCYGGQSPRSAEFQRLCEESNQLLNSIHDNIKNYNNGFGSRFATSSNRLRRQHRNVETSGERHRFGMLGVSQIDEELARIHRCCQNIDNNLFSMFNRSGASSNVQPMDVDPPTNIEPNPTQLNIFGGINQPQRSLSPINVGLPQNELPQSSNPFNFYRSRGGNGDVSTVSPPSPFSTPIPMEIDEDDYDEDVHSTNLINQHRRHNAFLAELQASGRCTSLLNSPSTSMGSPTCYLTEPKPWHQQLQQQQQQQQQCSYVATTDYYKCPICLENVRLREPFSTICGHVYCGKCIKTAFAVTRICPVCKKRLTRRQIFRIYI